MSDDLHALSVREVVLETLTLAPSSFAALYGSASRLIKRAIGVAEFWTTTHALAEEGFAELWLFEEARFIPPTAKSLEAARRAYEQWLNALPLEKLSVDALSIDPVGVWLTITPSGVEEAHKLAACDWPLWSIDVDYVSRTLVVQATTLELAREQANLFLERQGLRVSRVVEHIEPVESVEIQGCIVKHGVQVTLRY